MGGFLTCNTKAVFNRFKRMLTVSQPQCLCVCGQECVWVELCLWLKSRTYNPVCRCVCVHIHLCRVGIASQYQVVLSLRINEVCLSVCTLHTQLRVSLIRLQVCFLCSPAVECRDVPTVLPHTNAIFFFSTLIYCFYFYWRWH